jgi:HPt (histidine-containing phosphotransfer) domain-containing protein
MIADVGEEAFQRLARLFESETRGAVVEMRRLLGIQDWRELGRQAHSLKHSTASFGLTDLAAAALALETAADASNAKESAARVEQLEAMAEEELAELQDAQRSLFFSSPDVGRGKGIAD